MQELKLYKMPSLETDGSSFCSFKNDGARVSTGSLKMLNYSWPNKVLAKAFYFGTLYYSLFDGSVFSPPYLGNGLTFHFILITKPR